MKINKACDLSSISVFPPPNIYSRKASTVSSGLQASHSQHRSQPSQQSLSQGISSQHGMLSHFSQNSLDEAVTTNDQRVGSQEHEHSLRRMSALPRLTYSRDESQPPNSRSSSNLMLKWSSADHKSQLSEGLENRIGMMEASLSRFAMTLDSVQSDVIQVNKGTKEITLEMECIRQKLIAQDNSLQLMTKGQEEIKASIDGSLKSLSEQMNQITNKEKLQEVFLVVSALPQLIESSLQSVLNNLHNTTKEMQEISCNLKSLNQKDLAQPTISLKSHSKRVTKPKMCQSPAKEPKARIQATVAPKVETGGWKPVRKGITPKVETGGWKPVRKGRVTFSDRISEKVQKQTEPQTKYMRGGRDCTIVIESDEETDEGFSCLVEENAGLFGNLTKEEEKETERILREARRRKRNSAQIEDLAQNQQQPMDQTKKLAHNQLKPVGSSVSSSKRLSMRPKKWSDFISY